MPVKSYDPNKVTVSLGGKLIYGWANDTFITIEYDEDMWTKTIGIDGRGSRAKSNNYGAQATLTLLHTSESNDYIMSLYTADLASGTGVVPMLVRDLQGNSLATAATAWVKKVANLEFGRGVGNRVWTIDTDNLQLSIGGNT